jgi:hypothetical protein
MVPGAEHYRQAKFPELVSPAVVASAREFSPIVNTFADRSRSQV